MTFSDISESLDAPTPAIANHPLHYDGTIGALYAIWAKNLVLTIVTLGIYSFWARTRMRRYAAGSFALGGDRFEYLGTGGELFRGFLKALPIIVIVYLPLVVYPVEQYPLSSLMFFLIFLLLFVGLYAAIAYRLSRLSWRGIRGRLRGSAIKYAFIQMGLLFLTILTLGIIIPWADKISTRYVMGHVHFGTTQAVFGNDGGGLWRSHLVTALLLIPTLGLSRVWYRAAVNRYEFNNLSVGGLQFHSDQTGGQLLKLFVTNLLIVIFTLGIGTPIAVHRNLRFLSERIWVSGDLEAAAAKFTQSTESLAASGEGLAGALAMDGVF